LNRSLVKSEIRHGGDLHQALELYGGSIDQWVDLSTGISPWSYPAPAFNESAWRQLPPSNRVLIAAASAYYECDKSHIICTPGSQLAIRLIPHLLEQKQVVAIPLIGYQEHANSWQMAGHSVRRYRDYKHLLELIHTEAITNAVVINPNNPTAEKVAPSSLKILSDEISGILLVDEAFSDTDPSNSVCREPFNTSSNMIVLRSIGKFFGLAGARIGFVIGIHPIVTQLNQLLSPWSISGPSLKLASLALSDTQWQAKQRQRISENAQRQRLVLDSIKRTDCNYSYKDQSLFFSVFASHSAITSLHTAFAEQKIWTRLGDPYLDQGEEQLNWLRLSLVGERLDRLAKALVTININ